MLFNTKVRYGLAVIFALAHKENYVSIQVIANELGLSKTYLEQVFTLLKNNQIVEALKGPQGGYRLQNIDHLDIYSIFSALDPTLTTYEDETSLLDAQLNQHLNKFIYKPIHQSMESQLKSLKVKDLLIQINDPMYFI